MGKDGFLHPLAGAVGEAETARAFAVFTALAIEPTLVAETLEAVTPAIASPAVPAIASATVAVVAALLTLVRATVRLAPSAVAIIAAISSTNAVSAAIDTRASAKVRRTCPIAGATIVSVTALLATVGAAFRCTPATVAVAAARRAMNARPTADHPSYASTTMGRSNAVRRGRRGTVTIVTAGTRAAGRAAAYLPAARLAVAAAPTVLPIRLAVAAISGAKVVCPRALAVVATRPTSGW